MFDSQREKMGNSEVTDFEISKVFGLDWKQYCSQRMYEFITIINFQNKRREREMKKNK